MCYNCAIFLRIEMIKLTKRFHLWAISWCITFVILANRSSVIQVYYNDNIEKCKKTPKSPSWLLTVAFINTSRSNRDKEMKCKWGVRTTAMEPEVNKVQPYNCRCHRDPCSGSHNSCKDSGLGRIQILSLRGWRKGCFWCLNLLEIWAKNRSSQN